jgi:TetR/AcrR family transcriptional repressor of nem operon
VARRDKALATFASMVGAMVLARAVDEPELSARILGAVRNSIDAV